MIKKVKGGWKVEGVKGLMATKAAAQKRLRAIQASKQIKPHKR